MRIVGETFRADVQDGQPGWHYQVTCGLDVKGQERLLSVQRWVTLREANGYWHEPRGRDFLVHLRERCDAHLRERAEVDDPVLKMRPRPPTRAVWTPEAVH